MFSGIHHPDVIARHYRPTVETLKFFRKKLRITKIEVVVELAKLADEKFPPGGDPHVRPRISLNVKSYFPGTKCVVWIQRQFFWDDPSKMTFIEIIHFYKRRNSTIEEQVLTENFTLDEVEKMKSKWVKEQLLKG